MLPRRREATCGASRSRRPTSVAGEARRGYSGRARVVWGASPRQALHVPAPPPWPRPALLPAWPEPPSPASTQARPMLLFIACCTAPASAWGPVHLHRPVTRLPRSPPRGKVKRGLSAWPGGDLAGPPLRGPSLVSQLENGSQAPREGCRGRGSGPYFVGILGPGLSLSV